MNNLNYCRDLIKNALNFFEVVVVSIVDENFGRNYIKFEKDQNVDAKCDKMCEAFQNHEIYTINMRHKT